MLRRSALCAGHNCIAKQPPQLRIFALEMNLGASRQLADMAKFLYMGNCGNLQIRIFHEPRHCQKFRRARTTSAP